MSVYMTRASNVNLVAQGKDQQCEPHRQHVNRLVGNVLYIHDKEVNLAIKWNKLIINQLKIMLVKLDLKILFKMLS